MKTAFYTAIIISLAYQALKAEPQYATALTTTSLPEAIAQAANGQQVYKCELVELKIGKTSIGLKKKGQ